MKTESIKIYEEQSGKLFEDWPKEEQIHHWYSEVEQRGIDDAAVDGLFSAINECMESAKVPKEYWNDVFDLINDDYIVRKK